jgi:hypothetical protein
MAGESDEATQSATNIKTHTGDVFGQWGNKQDHRVAHALRSTYTQRQIHLGLRLRPELGPF